MFEFIHTERTESDAPASQERYADRIVAFQLDGKRWPKLRHDIHWLLHNVVVHPMLGAAPGALTVRLHDLSSRWLNKGQGRSSVAPRIADMRAWRHHNITAHILIGLVPCEDTFRMHDRTAAEMNVIGWV